MPPVVKILPIVFVLNVAAKLPDVIRVVPETSNLKLGETLLIPTLPPVVYKFPNVLELNWANKVSVNLPVPCLVAGDKQFPHYPK